MIDIGFKLYNQGREKTACRFIFIKNIFRFPQAKPAKQAISFKKNKKGSHLFALVLLFSGKYDICIYLADYKPAISRAS